MFVDHVTVLGRVQRWAGRLYFRLVGHRLQGLSHAASSRGQFIQPALLLEVVPVTSQHIPLAKMSHGRSRLPVRLGLSRDLPAAILVVGLERVGLGNSGFCHGLFSDNKYPL